MTVVKWQVCVKSAFQDKIHRKHLLYYKVLHPKGKNADNDGWEKGISETNPIKGIKYD